MSNIGHGSFSSGENNAASIDVLVDGHHNILHYNLCVSISLEVWIFTRVSYPELCSICKTRV